MGTTARARATVGVWMVGVIVMAGPASAQDRAGQPGGPSPNLARSAGLTIQGAHDGKSAWMAAQYRQLQIRKKSDRATGATVIDLRTGRDHVVIGLAQGRVSVERHGRLLVVDSAEALEAAQQLLGGSAAIFGARTLLSQLEATSTLDAPEMSLLGAAAFVAALVGDVEAPRRLADRFMEKHRGIFRHVAARADTCWTTYTKESSAAWNDLQACMEEAEDDGFFSGAYQRLACNGIWAMRSEAAWFEFLKCLSPLSALPQ